RRRDESCDLCTDEHRQAEVWADRSKVHRWLRRDWGFQATYNAAKHDLQREVEARLFHLAEIAADVVVHAVRNGDLRAALAVLKGLGVFPGVAPAIGGEDPDELAEENSAYRDVDSKIGEPAPGSR